MLLAGCQLDRSNFRKEYHQGHLAVQGVSTTLPFVLEFEPIAESAVWVFLDGRIAVNGRDFSVNTATREITWLDTAPYGVSVSNWMEIDYFAKY